MRNVRPLNQCKTIPGLSYHLRGVQSLPYVLATFNCRNKKAKRWALVGSCEIRRYLYMNLLQNGIFVERNHPPPFMVTQRLWYRFNPEGRLLGITYFLTLFYRFQLSADAGFTGLFCGFTPGCPWVFYGPRAPTVWVVVRVFNRTSDCSCVPQVFSITRLGVYKKLPVCRWQTTLGNKYVVLQQA